MASVFHWNVVFWFANKFCFCYCAVLKRLLKLIMWLRLLCLVIGLKDSRQFFNKWEAKPKPIVICTRHFFRALSELQVVSRNCDWFNVLFAPAVIGRSDCLGLGFSTVIWKQLYWVYLNIILWVCFVCFV